MTDRGDTGGLMQVDTLGAGPLAAVDGVRRAEAHGFDGIWFGDYGMDPLDAVVVGASAACRVRLGTAVAGIASRNPMATAYRLAAAQGLAGQVVHMGIGTQIRPVVTYQYGERWDRPLQRAVEFRRAVLEIWQAWCEGRQPRHRGAHFRHVYCPQPSLPELPVPEPPQILLGAVGPRARALAAVEFDGLILHPFTPPDYLRAVVAPEFRRTAGTEASTPSAPPDLVMPSMLHCVTTEAATVEVRGEMQRRLWAWIAAGVHDGALSWLGLADVVQPIRTALRRQDWSRAGDVVGDDVVDAFCCVGPPEVIRAAAAERYAGVVDRLTLVIHREVPLETARRLVEQVRTVAKTKDPP